MALFKEVVDLSHEMFNNMLGVSSTSMAAFWPVETHERSAANSQGQLCQLFGHGRTENGQRLEIGVPFTQQ